MDLMTKEESYAERRQLFKNIWDTAMTIEEKDCDIMNKPKTIKTLRLDEVDKCVGGRKKKQRIRNLRTVCKKILDFCDRQDADDLFYEQIISASPAQPQQTTEILPKNVKVINKVKKKLVKKAKSLFSPPNEFAQAKATTSERKDGFWKNAGNKTSRNTSPLHFKRTTILRSSEIANKSIKSKKSPQIIKTARLNVLGDTTRPRKIIKKKQNKKKKPVEFLVTPGIPDTPEPYEVDELLEPDNI